MSSRIAPVALALLVVAGAACGGRDEQSPGRAGGSGDDRQIVFPTRDEVESTMQALVEGTLVEREGCLYVSTDDAPGHVLPIWPNGFSYRESSSGLEVVDPAGEVAAELGAAVSLDGGMAGKADEPLPPALADRVGRCDGPYWLVGEVSSRGRT